MEDLLVERVVRNPFGDGRSPLGSWSMGEITANIGV